MKTRKTKSSSSYALLSLGLSPPSTQRTGSAYPASTEREATMYASLSPPALQSSEAKGRGDTVDGALATKSDHTRLAQCPTKIPPRGARPPFRKGAFSVPPFATEGAREDFTASAAVRESHVVRFRRACAALTPPQGGNYSDTYRGLPWR